MAISLYCLGERILRVKNITFDHLHSRILELIEEEGINLSDSLRILLEEMDQNVYGFGCIFVDIADHIKSKKDLTVLSDLVKQAIETGPWVLPAAEDVLNRLWNFYAELLKYGEKLS